jgi:hypothetical protein
MTKKVRVKSQPRVRGGRQRLSPYVMHSIDIELNRLASYCRVSKSWVIATILADALHIKDQAQYEVPKIRRVK